MKLGGWAPFSLYSSDYTGKKKNNNKKIEQTISHHSKLKILLIR